MVAPHRLPALSGSGTVLSGPPRHDLAVARGAVCGFTWVCVRPLGNQGGARDLSVTHYRWDPESGTHTWCSLWTLTVLQVLYTY